MIERPKTDPLKKEIKGIISRNGGSTADVNEYNAVIDRELRPELSEDDIKYRSEVIKALVTNRMQDGGGEGENS